ncbi:hypothetical protein VXQ18_15625 [Brucella abortus]|nr:hypothetical protein [Brucella abortus]
MTIKHRIDERIEYHAYFPPKITRLCGVAAMALALSSAAYAADITVKHAQGETADSGLAGKGRGLRSGKPRQS